MKITSISLNRVYSLGNYENEKLGVTIELEEGDHIQQVFDRARDVVYLNSEKKKSDDEKKRRNYDRAVELIKYPDNYHISQLNQAYGVIADYEGITVLEAKKKHGFHNGAFDLVSSENALPSGEMIEEDDDDYED